MLYQKQNFPTNYKKANQLIFVQGDNNGRLLPWSPLIATY